MKTDLQRNPIRESSKMAEEMYSLVVRLFPICRSITGNGVRETLGIIREHIPLEIHEVPTGTQVFDWIIPKEWNIRDAFILDEQGNKIVDFKENNLHIVGYSVPINTVISLSELQKHLYSKEEQPDAIPYVTSYYEERWGFCMAHCQRKQLKEGRYRVFIDSELKNGHLTYGECLIPGRTEKEIFLSTYICHPSMANNELSGPAVTTFLTKWVSSFDHHYTYRVIFIPETIGAIVYLSKNLTTMKKNVIAGFNITCVGDERAYSFIPSRRGNTLADKAALNVLGFKHPDFIRYSYLDRASDERQYCSPGVDLPLVSVMRSKYAAYPEYHTSLDNMDLVTPNGLEGTFELLKDCIELLEKNKVYRTRCLGEPQLGKRGLYPNLNTGKSGYSYPTRSMLNFLAYADGTNDVIGISSIIGVPPWELYPMIERLKQADLIFESPP